MTAWEYLPGTTGDAWERMCGTKGDAWTRLAGSVGDAWTRLIAPCGAPSGAFGAFVLLYPYRYPEADFRGERARVL
jgi:hypothetical protein